MFIRISNRGLMPREALTVFGYTNKRDRMDDPNVVGNKGSGLKLAALAALRLGITVGVSSTDALGRYFLRYEARENALGPDMFPQVFLHWARLHDDGTVSIEVQPWFMTIGAFQDWDQPIGDDASPEFNLTREIIANAWDEDKDPLIDAVDTMLFAPEGRTVVYLSRTPGIVRVLARPERYFKFLCGEDHQPLFVAPGIGAVYPRSDARRSRLFVTRVNVLCSVDPMHATVLDYDMELKTLASEERTVKDIGAYAKRMALLFAAIRDVELATHILKGALRGSKMEAAAFYRMTGPDEETMKFWLGVVNEVAGGVPVCLTSGNTTVDKDAEQIYGHRVLKDLSFELKEFFRRIGIKDAAEVAPERSRERFVDPAALSPTAKADFAAAFDLLRRYMPEYASVPIRFYETDDATDTRAGYYDLAKDAPQELRLHVLPGEEGYVFPEPLCGVITTVRHEGRHWALGVDDYDRRFNEEAELQINRLLARLEGRTADYLGTPLHDPATYAHLQPVLPLPDAPTPDILLTDLAPPAVRERAATELDRAFDGLFDTVPDMGPDPFADTIPDARPYLDQLAEKLEGEETED